MPTKKIVLSNDATLLDVLKNSFFQREGFGMVLVQDSQAGFQAVEADAPALAVFDLEQLGEQALECCRAIKNDALLAATPVLLLLPETTAEELNDACWNAGCDAVVKRPLTAESILDAACSLLGISRRLERRFPVNFQVELLDSTQKKHIGHCVNLNTGGMFLSTEKLFPADTRLAVEFTLPGSQNSLHFTVRVAWVNHPEWRKKSSTPCGLGLRFENPGQAVNSALQKFLDSLKIED